MVVLFLIIFIINEVFFLTAVHVCDAVDVSDELGAVSADLPRLP